MSTTNSFKLIMLYGFAIFAMFFGSGNLVFPIQIGFAGENHWVLGFVGLFLTGIIIPLMGLFVIKFYQGSYQLFFSEAGNLAGKLLPLIILSLLGSFGVVPRCITVSFGSINYFYPQVGLLSFSLFFCVSTYFLCLNDRIMVRLLGKWMSPVLLIILLLLIGIAVYKAPSISGETSGFLAFDYGFFTGYQTMDLFASFFFSALIFQQIQQQLPKATRAEVIRFAIAPSLIGAALIAFIYVGLVYLGAHYASFLRHTPPELMLPAIAFAAMGEKATLFLSLAMFFSCITTAVALNNLFARYLCTSLNLEERYFSLVLLITTVLSFAVSLLDFKGIAAFLIPMLQATYPALIALTALCLLSRNYQFFKKTSFYIITLIAALSLMKQLAF